MLVTLKEILVIAEEKKMAVGAFNAANLESLEGNIRAAEETGMPIVSKRERVIFPCRTC